MSLLLITLPPGPPGSYVYATSADGQTVAAHGQADAALLPSAGRGADVVAVVPATQLSWHRVSLPRGIGPGSPRLRASLVGLLEEQLLDDPEQLHFALGPDATAGGTAWVAVCDKAWLTAHLHALDAAGRPANRIVPELWPRHGALRLTVTGEPDRPWVQVSGDAVSGGAQALPLTQSTLALLSAAPAGQTDGDAPAAVELLAEPAVAALAEQMLQSHVTIQQPTGRLLAASRSGWDLAQLDLARTGTARAAKRIGAGWRDFLHAPSWRPARWGVALLLLVNLAGLNVLAWRTRHELAARQDQINTALTQAFPQVKVVVDAPVQMQREIAALRQSTGAASARDLEPMLSALGQNLPGTTAPSAVEFAAGDLRFKGVQVVASALAEANQRLGPLGYTLKADADGVVLREETAR